MKNIRRTILTGVALVSLSAGLATADSIPYATTTPGGLSTFTGTSFSDTLTLPSFDPALGTLTGVELIGNANFLITLTMYNFGSGTEGYSNAYATGAANITGPAGLTMSISAQTGFESDSSLAPVLSCNETTAACTPSDVYPSLPATGSATVNPSDLADYIGGPAISLSFQFNGGPLNASTGTTEGNDISANPAGSGNGSLEVIYTFTDAPTSGVPEPASLVLMGSALIGIGLLRKRLKA